MASNTASAENMNVSIRQGSSFHFRQIRDFDNRLVDIPRWPWHPSSAPVAAARGHRGGSAIQCSKTPASEHGAATTLVALTSGAYKPASSERIAVVVCGANTDFAR